MTDLNHLVLRGRLSADAKEDYKESPNGFSYGTFCICVNRSIKVDGEWKDQPHFIGVHAIGNAYKSAVKYMGKGDVVCIEGHLEQDRYETKEGKKVTKLVVCADRIYPTYKAKNGNYSEQPQEPVSQEVAGEFPEDIPF